VTAHLNDKLNQNQSLNIRFPRLITTYNSNPFLELSGTFWRVFSLIPDCYTYQKAQNRLQAYEAGKILGLFQFLLSDLKTKLHEIIPGFHDLKLRLKQFDLSLKKDSHNRKIKAEQEIKFSRSVYEKLKPFLNILDNHQLPRRITHNDTKFNNILFNQNDQAISLIDLDTVMPGYVYYDFGDAIRTLANSAEEDEKDLTRVDFDKDIYAVFKEGYLETAKVFLTDIEKHWLTLSPIYMTFIIGLRFLTDYINGDSYFKIEYPDHNLIRAGCQFELIRKMEGNLEKY
jgi:hypothetical protein